MANKSKTEARSKFAYKIDRERLLEFSKMSVEARLEWLEEANKFLNTIKDKRIRKKWQMFREKTI